jgi:hypothetical protein
METHLDQLCNPIISPRRAASVPGAVRRIPDGGVERGPEGGI